MPTNQDSTASMSTTTSQLARAFGVVIRQVADLLMMLQDYHALAPNLPKILDISNQEIVDLQMYLECRLKPTWDWLISIMDATEAQLRFGSVLSSSATTNPLQPHPSHSNYTRSQPAASRDEPQRPIQALDSTQRRPKAGTDGNSARRDFLTYALSLMRSHNNEHADCLPATDISSLKHVAYILDALIYYMRSGSEGEAETMRDTVSVQSWQDPDDNLNDDADDDPVNQSITMETDSMDGDSDAGTKSGRRHSFFQRSDSTIFLGCAPPDPFQVSLVESLPLAEQPHLLHPYSRKEELFGMPRQTVSAHCLPIDLTDAGGRQVMQHQQWPLDRLPTHMALSYRASPGSLPISSSVIYNAPMPGPPELHIPTYPNPAPPAHSLSGHQSSAVVDMSNFASSVIVSPPSSIPMSLSSFQPGIASIEGSYSEQGGYDMQSASNEEVGPSSHPAYMNLSSTSSDLSNIPLPSSDHHSAMYDIPSDLSTDSQQHQPSSSSFPQPGVPNELPPPYHRLPVFPSQLPPQMQLGQPSVIVHAGSNMNLSVYPIPHGLSNIDTSAAHRHDHPTYDDLRSGPSSEMGLDLSNPSKNLSSSKSATEANEASNTGWGGFWCYTCFWSSCF